MRFTALLAALMGTCNATLDAADRDVLGGPLGLGRLELWDRGSGRSGTPRALSFCPMTERNRTAALARNWVALARNWVRSGLAVRRGGRLGEKAVTSAGPARGQRRLNRVRTGFSALAP